MAFISAPCRLQTSVTEVTDEQQVDVHPVFAQNQVPVGVIEKFSNLPVNVVSLAWAVLLRSYVLSDTVSFVLFSSPQDEVLQDSQDQHAPVSGSRGENRNASVYQYHLDSDRKWEDWSPDANQELSLEAIKNLQINTAVRQWTSGDLDRHQSSYPRSGGSILVVSINFVFGTLGSCVRSMAKRIMVLHDKIRLPNFPRIQAGDFSTPFETLRFSAS